MANPKGTIVQFRNILGKKFDDDYVQRQASKYRMDIVAHPEDPSVVAYETKIIKENDEEDVEHHTVNEVTSKYLAKLKDTAESYHSTSVAGCVISIPAHFEEAQKEALIASAHSAGFKVVYPIHEPVAACLAFDNLDQETKLDKQVLVLDLGAYQFNLTHLSCHDGLYTIEESIEVDNLGGIAFDEAIVQYVVQEFKKKYKMDITDNRRSMQKLRTAAERTKRMLTSKDTAPCAVESLYDGLDYNGTVLRGRFEMLAEPLYVRCKEAVNKTLESCKLNPEQIDEVILIGGSSRMPRFQQVIKSLFPETTQFRVDIEPDEAISIGCGIQAKIFLENGIDFENVPQSLTNADHLSQSLGIQAANGAFVPIIPEGTPLPVRRAFSFGVAAGQTEAYVAVYEGESKVAKENKLLAEASLTEIIGTKETKVEVVMIVEQNGVLSLTLSEKQSGQKTKIEVK
ncbi:heat shock protein 70 family [Gorgonomyces haynaldii]|nr:heat shock protein 70 family [Gorgonomyces haynaldii]